MNKNSTLSILLCMMLLFATIVFARISTSEAHSDLNTYLRLISNLDTGKKSDRILNLEEKIKGHPDVYMDVIDQEMQLPTDINILCHLLRRDSVTGFENYNGYVGTLFYYDSERARDMLYEQYQLQVALLHDIRREIIKLEKLDYLHPDYELIDCAYQLVLLMQSDFITSTVYYERPRYVNSYIERFGEIEWGLNRSMLDYFEIVTPNNPQVITKLKELYFKYGTQRYRNPSIRETLIKIGVPDIASPLSYSVIALRSIHLHPNSRVASGFVAVDDGVPDFTGDQLIIENNVEISDSSDVLAPSIQIRPNAEVHGNVFCRSLDNRARFTGSYRNPRDSGYFARACPPSRTSSRAHGILI
ncbi:MAG: hypothetical protein U5R06_13535 [candidate division KSB1 bacterium]|nr:hypothetical protein [candidate division KSB1 bacterium]